MLKGYRKKGFRLDNWLPVTLPILERILSSASKITFSDYDTCLYRAMCATAFFAFLRVGEITVNGKQSSNPPLQLHQVSKLCNSLQFVKSLKITFGDYKHNYNTRPFAITVHHQTAGPYPVKCVLDYLDQRSFILARLCLGTLLHFFSLQPSGNVV